MILLRRILLGLCRIHYFIVSAVAVILRQFILVFVVLGGQGNMLGSIIAAAVLTILPEALREYSDYRMLVYAILLIVMMLATNNPTIKGFLENLKNKITHKDTKKKEGV